MTSEVIMSDRVTVSTLSVTLSQSTLRLISKEKYIYLVAYIPVVGVTWGSRELQVLPIGQWFSVILVPATDVESEVVVYLRPDQPTRRLLINGGIIMTEWWGAWNKSQNAPPDELTLENIIDLGPTEKEEFEELERISVRLPKPKTLLLRQIYNATLNSGKKYGFSMVCRLIMKTGVTVVQQKVQQPLHALNRIINSNVLNYMSIEGLSGVSGVSYDNAARDSLFIGGGENKQVSMYMFSWCLPVVQRLIVDLSLGTASCVVELCVTESLVTSKQYIPECAKVNMKREISRLDDRFHQIASDELHYAMSLKESGHNAVDNACDIETLLDRASYDNKKRVYEFPSGFFYGNTE